jgi:hypothetical protein
MERAGSSQWQALWLEQLVELGGRLDAEPIAKQTAAKLVLPQRLDPISLGEVHPDHDAVSALA